jgi:hypothetical protein
MPSNRHLAATDGIAQHPAPPECKRFGKHAREKANQLKVQVCTGAAWRTSRSRLVCRSVLNAVADVVVELHCLRQMQLPRTSRRNCKWRE